MVNTEKKRIQKGPDRNRIIFFMNKYNILRVIVCRKCSK